MKKSKAVPLLLLGSTALLAGCMRNDAEQEVQETRQDAYSTREACDRDWERNACSSSGGFYVGPRYFYSHGNSTPYIIDPDGRTRAVPSHYGAYSSHSTGAAGVLASAPGRITTVTHASSISRGGFGGGRSSGSSGG